MGVSVELSISSGVNDSPFDFSWSSHTLIEKLLDKIAYAAFQTASYLTDPLLKGHELYRKIAMIDAVSPNTPVYNLAKKVAVCMGMIGWFSLAVVTTLPGIALRALGAYLQKSPYIYEQGKTLTKVLPADKSFTLLSWNVCGNPGGHCFTDAGVVPWRERIDRIVDKIIEKNADVNCLYEVFDIQTGSYIAQRLKQQGYSQFYFNIGPTPLGVSSGIMIASKYNIKNPEFTLYPKDSLVGRTKFAAKGVFAFDLECQGHEFARIFSTHLQHSEASQCPTAEEIEARKKQMQIIIDKVDAVRNRCVVVTGDLNLDDQEYLSSSWQHRFQKGDRFAHEKTWGGSAFCSKLFGGPASGPLNLDHTMVLTGTAREILTTLVQTGFDGMRFIESALSDHEGLFSRIAIQ